MVPDPADESEPGDADGRGDDADRREDADLSDDDGVPADPLDALVTALALKDERRTGWQLRGVTDPEPVAAHSWGVSLLALLFTPSDVDRDRVLRMAVVHDLGEAVVGDVPTRADPADQPLDRESKPNPGRRTRSRSTRRSTSSSPPRSRASRRPSGGRCSRRYGRPTSERRASVAASTTRARRRTSDGQPAGGPGATTGR